MSLLKALWAFVLVSKMMCAAGRSVVGVGEEHVVGCRGGSDVGSISGGRVGLIGDGCHGKAVVICDECVDVVFVALVLVVEDGCVVD